MVLACRPMIEQRRQLSSQTQSRYLVINSLVRYVIFAIFVAKIDFITFLA